MNKFTFQGITITLIFSIFFLNGCHSTSPLVKHPKGVVRYPAKFGEALGGTMVGCVITAPFLAVALATGPLAPMMGKPMGKAAGGVINGSKPAFRVVEDYFTVPLIAGVPWLMFGWWGNENDDEDNPDIENIVKKKKGDNQNPENTEEPKES